jgi:hypothetical protein
MVWIPVGKPSPVGPSRGSRNISSLPLWGYLPPLLTLSSPRMCGWPGGPKAFWKDLAELLSSVSVWHLGPSGAMTQSIGVWGAAWTSLSLNTVHLAFGSSLWRRRLHGFPLKQRNYRRLSTQFQRLDVFTEKTPRSTLVCESLIHLKDFKSSMSHVIGEGYCYFRSFWTMCTF